jgi:hypothetical protein
VFENGGAMIAAEDGVVKAIAGEGEPPRRKDAKNFFIKHLGGSKNLKHKYPTPP